MNTYLPDRSSNRVVPFGHDNAVTFIAEAPPFSRCSWAVGIPNQLSFGMEDLKMTSNVYTDV